MATIPTRGDDEPPRIERDQTPFENDIPESLELGGAREEPIPTLADAQPTLQELREQLAQEQQRGEALRLREEILRTREQNRSLELRLAGPRASHSVEQATPSSSASYQPSPSTTSLSRKRSASGTLDREPSEPPNLPEPERGSRDNPRPEKLEKYMGASLKEHKDWIRSAGIAFRLAPKAFRTDTQKIAWVSQYLRGTPRDMWFTRIETLKPLEDHTWAEFETFLLDQVMDPTNRGLIVAQAFTNALQRENQSAHEFDA
jgi:hypothetical protein